MRGRRPRIAIDLTLGLDQSHRHPLARKREGAYRPDRTSPHDNGIISFAARHTGPQWGDDEKSKGTRLDATWTRRTEGGVLRLRPTKRGTPLLMTLAIAGMSPLASADKASPCDPPSGASIMTRSASAPSRKYPPATLKCRALLPLAAAIAISGASLPRLAT